jgi:flagellar basal-body rod protein FlgB
MLNNLLETSPIRFLEQAAVFGERRHEVLTGNIANIDTPGYKMRDLPVEAFEQALKSAIENSRRAASGGPESLSLLNMPESSVESFPQELFLATEAASQNITFQDGNNRGVEHENMELLKNFMKHTFAIEVMNSQMSQLHAVISERP